MDDLFNLVKDQKKKEEGAQAVDLNPVSVAKSAKKIEVEQPVRKKKPDYHFKGIKAFNKKLTSKHLMHSDLCEDTTDKDYKDKVAACF